MRPFSQTSKENLRSIVNQKNSILKHKPSPHQPCKPLYHPSHTTSISNFNSNKPSAKLGILHKFIQNGSRYETNSRRESIESKVSRVSIGGAGLSGKFMEDTTTTTNYSDEIKILKERNRELVEENRELRKMVEGERERVRMSAVSSQKSFNSFELVGVLEDSNRVLKRKFEQSRKSTLNEEKEGREKSKFVCEEISRMSMKGVKEFVFPDIKTLARVAEEYIEEYDNLFVNIQFLAKHIQSTSDSQPLSALNQLLSNIEQSIRFRNRPQSAIKRSESKQTIYKKLKSKTKSTTRRSPDNSLMEAFAPELLSPEDTFKMLEKLLEKIGKSQSMLETLRNKQLLLKLMKKLL